MLNFWAQRNIEHADLLSTQDFLEFRDAQNFRMLNNADCSVIPVVYNAPCLNIPGAQILTCPVIPVAQKSAHSEIQVLKFLLTSKYCSVIPAAQNHACPKIPAAQLLRLLNVTQNSVVLRFQHAQNLQSIT